METVVTHISSVKTALTWQVTIRMMQSSTKHYVILTAFMLRRASKHLHLLFK